MLGQIYYFPLRNVTYYFRAYCAYRGTFYYGEVKAFSFNWDGPKISTLGAVFDNGSYELSGTIENLGATLRKLNDDIDSLSYGFECSTNSMFEKVGKERQTLQRVWELAGLLIWSD